MGRLTIEQAIEYWKIFLDEIEELKTTPGTDLEEWDKQEKATVAALEALAKQRHDENLKKQGRLIEQKHGTWNYINGGIINPHFRCSICYAPRFEHYAANDFNFCPACGAKMVSEVKLKELEDGTV